MTKHQMPTEVREGHRIPCGKGDRWLGTTIWVLGMESRCPGRASSTPNYRANSAAPTFLFLSFLLLSQTSGTTYSF